MVPLLNTKMGSTEVLVLVPPPVPPVEEEFTSTLTVVAVPLVAVVTRLVPEVRPEAASPSRVPSTRNIGSRDKKMGVKSTCVNNTLEESTLNCQICLPRTRLCRAEGDTVDTVAGRRLEACSGGGSGSAVASRGNLSAVQTKCISISHTYPQCFAWHLQMFQIFSKHSFVLENTTLVSHTPHLCRSH